MSRALLIALTSVLSLAALSAYSNATGGATRTGMQGKTLSQTESIVTAATDFLNSLSVEQQGKALHPFPSEKTAIAAKFTRKGRGGPGKDHYEPRDAPPSKPEGPFGPHPDDQKGPVGAGRDPDMGPPGGFVGEQYGQSIWSNYPVSDVPRPGLQLGSLNAGQRAAAMHLLRVLLSVKGYQKVLDIMGSDQALAAKGTPFASGRDVYTLGIFGNPSAATPWMIQFGGHHLGLNAVLAGARGGLTPTLTGAQPAVYTAGGKTVRVLAGENDKAFVLLDALDDSQRKQAILNYRIADLVLGPGHEGETIPPEGLKASAMTEKQRARLLDVISEWAEIVNDAYAAPRMEELKAGLDDTYFAWSGPTTHEPGRNGSSYYRIQGPKVLIEFSPQAVGGDPTMHVHTIYRDPTNDYGRAWTSE